MPPSDFYEIFGVSPSASQEEIRAAHRELVKRYHPDIYSTSGDKARATEKLREINAAYAVLGNVERRRAYDARRAEPPKPPPPPRPQARTTQARAPQPRRPVAGVRRPGVDRAPAMRAVQALRNFPWKKKIFIWPRMAGAVAAVICFMVIVSWLNQPPEITPVWILLQKTETNGAVDQALASTGGWEQVGSFGVRAECARLLRSRVRADQEQGGQAIFDERNSTMAIIVFMGEAGKAAPSEASAPPQPAKRVRHYECRNVQVRQPESALRRKLRQIGIVD